MINFIIFIQWCIYIHLLICPIIMNMFLCQFSSLWHYGQKKKKNFFFHPQLWLMKGTKREKWKWQKLTPNFFHIFLKDNLKLCTIYGKKNAKYGGLFHHCTTLLRNLTTVPLVIFFFSLVGNTDSHYSQ